MERNAKFVVRLDESERGRLREMVDRGHGSKTIRDRALILLKADDVWPYQPRDYYWQRHLTRELTIVPVPGNHFTMVTHPNVAVLWERLKPLLDRYQSA